MIEIGRRFYAPAKTDGLALNGGREQADCVHGNSARLFSISDRTASRSDDTHGWKSRRQSGCCAALEKAHDMISDVLQAAEIEPKLP